MPLPPSTAKATLSAAASPNPGSGSPVLAAWLLVRRRNVLFSFSKRRYVVLTDDHVLLVDNTPVLHLVDSKVHPHASSRLIDLTPAPTAGLPVRIFADSPFQYSKWLNALQSTSDASLKRFYRLDNHPLLGLGVHGLVHSARPLLPLREHSFESSTAPSEYASRPDHQLHRYLPTASSPSSPSSTSRPRPRPRSRPLQTPPNHQSPSSSNHPDSRLHSLHHQNSDADLRSHRSHRTSDGTTAESLSRTRSRDTPRRLFKRRILSLAADRTSVDIDPDSRFPSHHHSPLPDLPIPSSRLDKRLFRQSSRPVPPSPVAASSESLHLPPHLPYDAHSGTSALSANSSTVQTVAVKSVSRSTHGSVTVASELLFALSRLNHFAIIKVLDVFQAVADVHIVMEYCAGGSVADYIHRHGVLSDAEAKQVFSPVLKAVGYLHACGIVHWDVNAWNVLLLTDAPPFEPKLIDYGTARPINPANGRVPGQYAVFMEKGKVASLACASPELLTSKAHRYASKADMWQLGCLLYFVLFGRLPFSRGRGREDETSERDKGQTGGRGSETETISGRILSFCKERSPDRRKFLFGDERSGRASTVGEDAKQLILKLLCPNPRMRPNALQCLKEFAFLGGEKT